MCFSSHTTRSTPAAAYSANACAGCSRKPSSMSTSPAAPSSAAGTAASAGRPRTGSSPRARRPRSPRGTVIRPSWYAVVDDAACRARRRWSSRSAPSCPRRTPSRRGERRTGSYQTRSRRHRDELRAPGSAARSAGRRTRTPVSRQIVLLTHSVSGHGRVAVDDHGAAPVLAAPTGSAPAGRTRRSRRWCRRTGERAHPARRAAVVRLRQPGVRDHEPAAVEHVVADQAVDERAAPRRGTPRARRPAAPATRCEAVGDAVTLRPRSARGQLVLVVARHAERGPGRDHAHDQAQHARACPGRGRPGRRRTRAVRPSGWRRRRHAVAARAPAERAQQRLQLGPAAVHVADDVERARSGRAGRCPALLGDDCRARRSPRRPCSTCTVRKPSRSRPRSERRRSSRWRRMTCGPKSRSGRAALRATRDLLRHVEHDRDRQHVVLVASSTRVLRGLRAARWWRRRR